MEPSTPRHLIAFSFSVSPCFPFFLFVIPVSLTACGISSQESETDSYNLLLPVLFLLVTENNPVVFS